MIQSLLFSRLLPVVTVFLFVSCSFSRKSAARLYKDAESAAPYDAIIVPGVPFKNNTWDKIMKGRIYWAKFLYDKGIAKNIIFSGSSVYTPYYEAEIMRLYAIELGIPPGNIFTEKKAEHSTENAYYSYKYGKKSGFNRMALASDPFQSKMLKKFIRKKVSKDVGIIPFVIDTLKKIEPTMIDPVINYEQAFNKNFISIKKRDSFWKRIRGTIKGNIDKTLYE
ncbi:MAG: YdcF family protein [Chitinophagaceae bacterium]|nr:YdcF family protein [Chitinophagaceae bacterium]